MESTYWITYLFVHIILGIIIGIMCSEVAVSKGYSGKGYFWAGFLFLFAGLLIVIAYKDLKSEEQNFKIISSLNDIKQFLSDTKINIEINKSQNKIPVEEEVKSNDSSKIKKNTKEKLGNTELKLDVKETSIIQGKILTILTNTIIVAHNDDKNDIVEVQHYPADKIVDEVWIKIKVKFLYVRSDLTKVVKFIETIQEF